MVRGRQATTCDGYRSSDLFRDKMDVCDREEEKLLVDSDDGEVFEINDFTNATPWERYDQ